MKPMPRAAPLHELALEGFCAHRRQKPGGDAAAILVVEMSIASSQRLIGLIPGVYRTIHAIKTCKRQGRCDQRSKPSKLAFNEGPGTTAPKMKSGGFGWRFWKCGDKGKAFVGYRGNDACQRSDGPKG